MTIGFITEQVFAETQLLRRMAHEASADLGRGVPGACGVVRARKKGQRKTAAHKGVKVKNLQRGTAAAADWEETRHVHQLCALCLIFDQLENIYCAMQLCINGRRAPRASSELPNGAKLNVLWEEGTPPRVFVPADNRDRHTCRPR
jgi:hypothetical protein